MQLTSDLVAAITQMSYTVTCIKETPLTFITGDSDVFVAITESQKY